MGISEAVEVLFDWGLFGEASLKLISSCRKSEWCALPFSDWLASFIHVKWSKLIAPPPGLFPYQLRKPWWVPVGCSLGTEQGERLLIIVSASKNVMEKCETVG